VAARSSGRPVAFLSAAAFRAWLTRHHARKTELLIRIFKRHAHAKGMTYFDALDEALCFGWIDGVRRGLDSDSFSIRFSPRRPGSIWSAVNIRRAGALEAAGRMRAAGLAAFRARTKKRSRVYAYESRPRALSPAFAKRLRSSAAAARFFRSQPPWYQRNCSFWVMSARHEATRERRLAHLIDCSARGVPIQRLKAAKLRVSPSRPR